MAVHIRVQMAARIRVEMAAVEYKVAAAGWNSYTPCILDFLMAKDFKASALHVSELSIALPWIPNNSPQSQIALVINKLSKHQNLTQFD